MVGNGQKARFLHDCWCGDRPLSYSFPSVFSITRCQDAVVADYMVDGSGYLVGNVQFTRSTNDWEVEEVSAFFSSLYEKVVRSGDDDKMQ